MGTGSFPGVKRPEPGFDHPLPSNAEAKERVDIYLYSVGLRGLFWGELLPLPSRGAMCIVGLSKN